MSVTMAKYKREEGGVNGDMGTRWVKQNEHAPRND